MISSFEHEQSVVGSGSVDSAKPQAASIFSSQSAILNLHIIPALTPPPASSLSNPPPPPARLRTPPRKYRISAATSLSTARASYSPWLPSISQKSGPSGRTPAGGRIAQPTDCEAVRAVDVGAVALGKRRAGQHVRRPLRERRGEQVLHHQQRQPFAARRQSPRRSTSRLVSAGDPRAADLPARRPRPGTRRTSSRCRRSGPAPPRRRGGWGTSRPRS